MEDGYWEALLRDVEHEVTEVRTPLAGPEAVSMPGADPCGEQRHVHREVTSVDEEADWRRAGELVCTGQTIMVVMSGYNRGGLLANFGGIQAFLPASHLIEPPASQLLAQRMAAMAERVGQELAVRVIEIERDRRRLILSERCAQAEGSGEALMSQLKPGQVCNGPVTNLCAFGAFVDLGGFEGLIHISELSWGRVSEPDEVVHPGDHVEVLVLDVNPKTQKVALSLKRLRPDPWAHVEERYHPGQIIAAVVTNVVSFGAFARLEDGLEGLVHISELAEGSFMHPRNVVNEGDHVRVRVLSVDGEHRRVALSMRCADSGRRCGVVSD
jgi:small subunit ribosomal protein S1